MANEKFTQLPTVTNAALSDIIAAVQGGVSSQETLGQIFTLMLANTILHNAGNPNSAVAGVVYQLCWDTTGHIMYVCTTSGNAATAVWTASGSISLPVSLANGGTSKALTASNGGLIYSDADSMEILAGTATAGQIPRSGASSAPTWSTATFASTYSASTILYSNGANAVAGLATANSAMLATNASGVPAWSASLTNGQVMIGSTGATPVPATITGSGGITVTIGAGTIALSGTGSGIGWNEITGTSASMVADAGYVANNAGLVTLTLPTTAAFGTAINVIGKGAGGWLVAQNSGQSIRIGSSTSTTGVAGSIASTNAADSIELICTVANTVWTSQGGPQGNITIA